MLKELKQTNTVTEYQSQFEDISTEVTGLSEQWLISFFIAGLQDQLKCELLLAQPTTYYQSVSLAKLHEQKLITLQNTLKNTYSKATTSFTALKPASFNSAYWLPGNKSITIFSGSSKPQLGSTSVNVKPTTLAMGSSLNNSTNSNHSFKSLTTIELKARREL